MARLPNITIEEKPVEYSEIDCAYFEAGKTPLVLWVSFSSILQGEKWPELPSSFCPPNGTWKLTHFSANIWLLENDDYVVFYDYIDPYFIVLFAYKIDGVHYPAFYKVVDSWPYHADANVYNIADDNYFYSGFFSISWIPVVGVASVGEIADSVGIERNAKTFFQGISESSTEGVYRFARRSDHSCIKIKVEKPL